MLELVIWGAIRDACASPFRRRARCRWATGPMARQATIGGQFLGTAFPNLMERSCSTTSEEVMPNSPETPCSWKSSPFPNSSQE